MLKIFMGGFFLYKIMIVEDDTVIRESLAIAIKKWNYEVICIDDFNDIMGKFTK